MTVNVSWEQRTVGESDSVSQSASQVHLIRVFKLNSTLQFRLCSRTYELTAVNPTALLIILRAVSGL